MHHIWCICLGTAGDSTLKTQRFTTPSSSVASPILVRILLTEPSYGGSKVHVVLFYKTAAGNQVVLEFIRCLDPGDRKIIGEDLRTVQLAFPIGLPVCDSLGDGLWEVRSTLSGPREARLIFFHSKSHAALVVVNAFIKKSQATPQAAIKLAKRRRREFES